MSNRIVKYNGKEHRVFHIKMQCASAVEEYDVILTEEKYRTSDTLAVRIMIVQENQISGCFSVLTVNLSDNMLQSDITAFIDTNNNSTWNCEEFLKRHKIATPMGIYKPSGFCTYPLYKFDLSKFYPKQKKNGTAE